MKQEEILKPCKQGLHPLIPIYSHENSIGETVIRWCPNCGSIVVDKEVDGKVSPGAVMKMKTSFLVQCINTNRLE